MLFELYSLYFRYNSYYIYNHLKKYNYNETVIRIKKL